MARGGCGARRRGEGRGRRRSGGAGRGRARRWQRRGGRSGGTAPRGAREASPLPGELLDAREWRMAAVGVWRLGRKEAEEVWWTGSRDCGVGNGGDGPEGDSSGAVDLLPRLSQKKIRLFRPCLTELLHRLQELFGAVFYQTG